MAVNPYIRDTAYFQVARDRGMMPTGENFDLQFNQLVNYINNKIVSALEILDNVEILGENGNSGAFLYNVGDGSTKYQQVTDQLIPNNEIEWVKLSKAPPASILATDINYKFIAITASEDNQFLISQNNDSPTWKKLTGESIAERGITGSKIELATIGAEHLEPTMIGRPLDNDAVEEPYIANNAITGAKVDLGAITPPKIENSLVTQARANLIFGSNKNPQVLSERTFTDNSLIFNEYFNGVNLIPATWVAGNSILLPVPSNQSFGIDPFIYLANQAIHPYHIAPRSFEISLTNASTQLSKEKLSPILRQRLRI